VEDQDTKPAGQEHLLKPLCRTDRRMARTSAFRRICNAHVSPPLCFVLFQGLRFGYSTLEKRHATASKLPHAMWKASTSNRWPDIGVFVTYGVMVPLRLAVRPHIAEVNVEFLAEN
jgi:hypothetical protein